MQCLVSVNTFATVGRYAFNLHLVGPKLKQNIGKIKELQIQQWLGKKCPWVLQEGEAEAEGQACPGPAHICCRLPCSWSVECWPARSPRGIVLQSFCSPLLRTSTPSLPLWVTAEHHRGPHQPDFQGALGWVTPMPQAGCYLPGQGAHTAWRGRALPLVGHQHSATRRKPRRICSGTLVLTSQLSGTLGGAFKFHLLREGVTSDLGCRAGSTSRNGSRWCKPCPCPSLSGYLFPQRYQANSKAFKQEGGLKKHATNIESCRQK